jgi:hypothetical protein
MRSLPVEHPMLSTNPARTAPRKGVVLLVASILVAVSLLPYFLLREEGRYMVWDNLDSVHVLSKTLLESGTLFAPNNESVPQMMNGLPRSSFPSEFYATTWLYALLGPLPSYIAERCIISFIALFGMFLLLNTYVIPSRENTNIAAGVAICFAVLPFWPYGGLSLAGIPLVTYAYLSIRSGKQKWFDWIFLLTFPLYSSLVLSGVFLVCVLLLILLRDSVRRKNIPWNQIAAISVLSGSFIVSHYRLFITFFADSNYVSHRVEFQPVDGFYDWYKTISQAISLFIHGQPHAHSLHLFIILPTVCAAVAIAYFRKLPQRMLLIGLACLTAISVLYGLSDARAFQSVDRLVRTIVPIEYSRFYFFAPIIWYCLFAVSLVYIKQACRGCALIPAVVLIAQLGVVYSQHELVQGELAWRKGSRHAPKYSEFYAVEQFQELRQFIGKPVESYKVGVVGMHPAIALYNGLYTIDGYASDYPLEYKQRFRRAIAGELAKNEYRSRYFDRWGSRAYLFTGADTEMMSTKWSAISKQGIDDISFDWKGLNELGAKYIISALPLKASEPDQLRLLKVFTHNNSAWDLYLYILGPTAS